MGESIKKIPKVWKDSEPQIEWEKISGFRNRLAHEYLSIDLNLIWNIVTNYLPDLERAIENISLNFWNN